MTVESDIRKTDGSEEHEHVGTIVPETTHDHSHAHSEHDLHEEGQHEKHDSDQQRRSTTMKSRLIPVFVGLIISLIIIDAQTAKANVIRQSNITSIAATADIDRGIPFATGSFINDIRIKGISSANEIDQAKVIDAGAAIGTIDRSITTIGQAVERIDSIDTRTIPICKIKSIAITVDTLIDSAGVING